jgi:hypothetical protein
LARLGLLNAPYRTARRRKPTLWIYDEGPKEETRRHNARIEMPTRFCEILFEFCRSIKNESRHGRTGLTIAASIFALSLKIFWSTGYDTLVDLLRKNRFFRLLAYNFPSGTPSIQTLCGRFGRAGEDPAALDTQLNRLITASAWPGRELDHGLLVDSDQIPTVMCANSRDRKFGGPPPAFRGKTLMVKRHLAVGVVSNLVGAVNTTLDYGLGSNDGLHLPSLARRAVEGLPKVVYVAADQQYSHRRNYRETGQLGLDLFIPEKANEHRMSDDDPWPEPARRLTALQREDRERFEATFRRRSKVEGTPSATKRHNGHLRLRARQNDPDPVYPPGLRFNEHDQLNQAVSKLEEDVIEAILIAAQTAVGGARRNEALATIFVHNIRNLTTLEHLHDQRVDFDDPDFAFRGIRIVSEDEIKVNVSTAARRPSEGNYKPA